VGDSITIGELNLDTAFNSYYLYSGGAIIDSLQSQITIAPSVTTTYVLEKRMCQSVYDTVTITVKPRFTADVISSTLYLCINDSLTLNTLNSIGSTMWSWQPNIAITNLNLQQPTVYPSQTLQYTVTTNFANSSNYCNSTFTDTVQIIVLSDDTCSEEINLIVPNIFSPNYDGLNDVFTIINFSGDIKEYSCTIFNRWGNLIFETKKRAQFWDGRSTSGIACEPGTYYYVIKAENSIGTKEYKGFVQLVR
jgi:gliding motility-associated-like protein